MKDTGPLEVIEVTTRVDRTTIRTEEQARQKWHLCRKISRHECLTKNLVMPQKLAEGGASYGEK